MIDFRTFATIVVAIIVAEVIMSLWYKWQGMSPGNNA